MNTTEIIKTVSKRLSISQREARHLIYKQIEVIVKHLCAGRQIVLRNFGSLSVKQSKPRKGYLPSKNQKVLLLAKKSAYFKPAKHLKDEVKDWNPS